jgi:hypothetical protein
MARANAVAQQLVHLGLPRATRIVIHAERSSFRQYEDDQGPDGSRLLGPAEHNRSVLIELVTHDG